MTILIRVILSFQVTEAFSAMISDPNTGHVEFDELHMREQS
jgi:hypothetical protein